MENLQDIINSDDIGISSREGEENRMFAKGQKVEFNLDDFLCGKGIIKDYESGTNQYVVKVVESDDTDDDIVYCYESEMKHTQFDRGKPMKYRVIGNIQVSVGITVEAESEEEAIQKAYEEFGGVRDYCGNGGTDKLIGVDGSTEWIEADGIVEFNSAEEYEE